MAHNMCVKGLIERCQPVAAAEDSMALHVISRQFIRLPGCRQSVNVETAAHGERALVEQYAPAAAAARGGRGRRRWRCRRAQAPCWARCCGDQVNEGEQRCRNMSLQLRVGGFVCRRNAPTAAQLHSVEGGELEGEGGGGGGGGEDGC